MHIGYKERMSMLFLAMVFKNCTMDIKSGNVLTSPEFTVSSSRELTFTMTSVEYFYDYTPVHVYKTSMFRHIDTLLGSYSLEFNTSADGSETIDNYTVCMPAGTYQLVFIASHIQNVTESLAAIIQILLTDSPCTYTSLAGL